MKPTIRKLLDKIAYPLVTYSLISSAEGFADNYAYVKNQADGNAVVKIL